MRKSIYLLLLLNGLVTTSVWAQDSNPEFSYSEKKQSFALYDGLEGDPNNDPNNPNGGGGLGGLQDTPVGDDWWICLCGAVLYGKVRKLKVKN